MLTITPLETAGVELLPPDIVWNGTAGDFVLAAGTLQATDPIKTAVVMLLFSDARGTDEQMRRADETDKRGWVGDGFDVDRAAGETDLGSRLRFFRREALTDQLARDFQEEAARALQPLIVQGAVARLDVAAEAILDPPGNLLVLTVNLYGRDGSRRYADRFDILWNDASAL